MNDGDVKLIGRSFNQDMIVFYEIWTYIRQIYNLSFVMQRDTFIIVYIRISFILAMSTKNMLLSIKIKTRSPTEFLSL